MNLEQLVRPNIRAMKAYSSARDEYKPTDEVTLLDANENPYTTDYNRYPDPYQNLLKYKIGKLKKVGNESIFLGNGSDEAIDLIMRIFCEPIIDNIIIPDPTYGMYEVAAAIQNVTVKRVPLSENFALNIDDFLATIDSRTKIIFVCNPNNPTGNLFDSNSLQKLINSFQGIVVIDEAYIDFANSDSFINRIDEFKNLIVLQTFSKAWGLAGIRLGMAFSNPEIIQLFNKVKAPYNLSSVTQSLVSNLIDNNKDRVSTEIEQLIKDRQIMILELEKLHIIDKIYQSETNFILVKFKDHQKVYNQLKINKLIVRDRSSALNCNGCLRITIGTPSENKKVLKVLESL
ncbi:MAG: histidinol-phosphate transaminase [Fulvivirga sp.]|uniref:histidinol-phosphate transaminase n=1 Tax=Fulvivirga sp. TaxID=1931237 RepID=UPI0032EEE4EC